MNTTVAAIHKMMRYILLTVILFSFFTTDAQNFSWGYPYQIQDETNKNILHIVEDKLYRIRTHYDRGDFNYIVTVDQFNLDDLEKSNSLDLTVGHTPMGQASLIFHSLFQEKETDFAFFYTEYDRVEKKKLLRYRKTDIKTGTTENLITVSEIESGGEFLISQSPDRKYYAVLKELPFERRANEKAEFVLMDAKGKVLQQKAHEFNFPDRRSKHHELYVSNTGDVFLVKKIIERRTKPFLMVYHWNSASNTVSEISLKQEDDYQIYQYEVRFHENAFYFLGLLTPEGSTNVGIKIMDERHLGTRAGGMYLLKISPKGTVAYQKRNDFPEIPNLNLKDFLFDGNAIWAVYDRIYVDEKSRSASTFDYDYHYLNNGFFVNYINENTGELEWHKTIDMREPDTKNDNGDYLSALYYLHNGQLVLLYNETRNIHQGAPSSTFNRRFPIRETFSPTGSSAKEALLSAGIGVLREESFELNTQFIIPLPDGSYIIRARSRAEYKYGYMKP